MTSNSIGHNSPLKASNLITPIIIGKYMSPRKSDLHVMSDRKLTDRLEKILSLQMNKVIIFGTPKVHNSLGSEAWNNRGIVQNTIKNIKSNFDKKLQVIADVCVCQYNLSGHCGIINYKNKNPQVYLMGSNPTPRASNGGSKGKNIYLKSKVISESIL